MGQFDISTTYANPNQPFTELLNGEKQGYGGNGKCGVVTLNGELQAVDANRHQNASQSKASFGRDT